MKQLETLVENWKNYPHKQQRVIAFGSSNTELHWHSLGRFNWFSWLSSAMREWIGRHITTINQGIGGETSEDLIKRIDNDVLSFTPNLVIITIGGNDIWKHLTIQEYEDNLTQIITKIKAIKALPVLQTYYCLLYDKMDRIFLRFPKFVEVNRALSNKLNVPLIDQYRYFSPFYENNPLKYSEIMFDGLHVNPLGNALMGIIASRLFSLPDPFFLDKFFWEKVKIFLNLMSKYQELPSKVPYPKEK